tara:strand:+ start:174 stop:809 length:636 start_codon:yes stop_codon:yes gene_type:complete
MSSLNFCSLEDAFNNNTTKLKKKGKSRYAKVDDKIDDTTLEKILSRGRDLEGNSEPGEPRPKMSTDMDYVNSIADTYDKNSLFVQNREKDLLSEMNRDAVPNDIQNTKNMESKKEMEEMRMNILELSKAVKDLAKNINKPDVEKPELDVEKPPDIKEGYVNYNIDSNIVKNFKSKITFDNDQFNELLLYIFTGIFILIMIDYIFNLGKKAF